MEALYSVTDEERLRIKEMFSEKFPDLVLTEETKFNFKKSIQLHLSYKVVSFSHLASLQRETFTFQKPCYCFNLV